MKAAPLRSVVALVLAAVLLVCGGWSRPHPASRNAGSASAPAVRGALQEVAAPGGVQELAARLDGHVPKVEIVAPQDDALLPAGPWSLRLAVSDWPLADSGTLGPGPHLVVQLDQRPPLRIDRQAAQGPIAMPALEPGSHRLTVYAARPWGEAVKSPGAFQQIRLHRVGRNPAELPAPGSAQLIVSSPDSLQHQEPVLIDWLLIDAPLQHLRDDDTRWRLRVSVNGDSFLVDRQTPLWLRGFRRGSNAVQLELLDGRGEPLNPPFNSVVREVLIDGAPGPAWQRPSLGPAELAVLSGQGPAPGPSSDEPSDGPSVKPPAERSVEPSVEISEDVSSEPSRPPSADAARPPASSPQAISENQTPADPSANTGTEALPEAAGAAGTTVEGSTAGPAAEAEEAAAEKSGDGVVGYGVAGDGEAEAEALQETQSDRDAPAAPLPAPAARLATPSQGAVSAATQERLSTSSSLGGSARNQVEADGSLRQPKRAGPLAGLREKLGA